MHFVMKHRNLFFFSDAFSFPQLALSTSVSDFLHFLSDFWQVRENRCWYCREQVKLLPSSCWFYVQVARAIAAVIVRAKSATYFVAALNYGLLRPLSVKKLVALLPLPCVITEHQCKKAVKKLFLAESERLTPNLTFITDVLKSLFFILFHQ